MIDDGKCRPRIDLDRDGSGDRSRGPVRDPQRSDLRRGVHSVGAASVGGVVLEPRGDLIGEIDVVGSPQADIANHYAINDHVAGENRRGRPDGSPVPQHIGDSLGQGQAGLMHPDRRIIGIVRIGVGGNSGTHIGPDWGAIAVLSRGSSVVCEGRPLVNSAGDAGVEVRRQRPPAGDLGGDIRCKVPGGPVRDPQGAARRRIVHGVGAVGVAGVVFQTLGELVGETDIVSGALADVVNGEPIVDQISGFHGGRRPDGDTAPQHVHDLFVHYQGRHRCSYLGDGATIIGVGIGGNSSAHVGWDRGAIALFPGGAHGVGVRLPLYYGTRDYGSEIQGQGFIRSESGRGIP